MLPVPATPWLLFDYDDTLGGVLFPDGSVRAGASAYFACIDRFAGFMQAGGFDPERAKTLQHEIDLDLAHKHGFADKTRFASSMVQAYGQLCIETGKAFLPAAANICEEIGMAVFTMFPYVALEGALDVLDRTSRYYKIAVVTKGEQYEQRKKLHQSAVLSFADQIFVVDKKDDHDWDTVLHALAIENVEESWAIGNSAKADVNPLLARGFNGIHLAEMNGWAFEQAPLIEPHPGRTAKVVTDISHVLDVLPPFADR